MGARPLAAGLRLRLAAGLTLLRPLLFRLRPTAFFRAAS